MALSHETGRYEKNQFPSAGLSFRKGSDTPGGTPAPGGHVYGLLDLAAEVLHLANVAAKAFNGNPTMRDRFYGIKNSLLSALLQVGYPGVRASWERNAEGRPMLQVCIAGRRSMHCPFRRLSWPAQCKVIDAIGAMPG